MSTANNNPKKHLNKLQTVLLFAAVILTLILGSYALPDSMDLLGFGKIFRDIENTSLNWRFTFKSFASSSWVSQQGVTQRKSGEGIYQKINIASIDEDTIRYFQTYPLDNSVWANLLDSFEVNAQNQKYRPEYVLFDLYFDEHSPNPASDQALANAFSNYNGQFGAEVMLYPSPELKNAIRSGVWNQKDLDYLEKTGSDYHSDTIAALRPFELKLPSAPQNLPAFSRVRAPLPELGQHLTFFGGFTMDAEGETYQRMPLIYQVTFYVREGSEIKATNVYYPSVILSMTVNMLKSSLSNIEIQPEKIVIRDAVYQDQKMDFVIPVDDSYRLSINYKALANSGYYRVIPLKEFATGRVGYGRNSIVLIGLYVQGTANQKWASPLGDMFSVDHAAFAIGTIMNRDFIHVVPLWLNVIYVILLTLLIGLLVLRGIRSTIIGSVLSIAVPIGFGFGLFSFNIQLATMIPLITSLLTLIASEVYILVTEEREKRFIKSTFSKYVNPDLVNILIQNPNMLQLGGDDKEATMLFSDIRSFTTLSEGMTPNELISFLNIYLTRMTDIVMATHGTLDKYIGDAVVAFWGTPIELPNHALNACQAAIRMMAALDEFNAEQAKTGHKPIRIGIGLNTGTITVGNIGSEKKKNFTAIGDATTLAEDLQDDNKVYQTGIIISEFTYQKVKDQVVVRELDMIRVKGYDHPIRIYELLDVTA